jgi:hypothetical protein
MNTDSIEYVDGVAIGTTSEKDPAFEIKPAAIAKFGTINLEDVAAIKVVASGTKDGDGIYFCTTEEPKFTSNKYFKLDMKASDEMGEYIIHTTDNVNWTGVFSNFRLDIITGPGTFKLKKIELLGYDDSLKPYSIIVDTKPYKPYLTPEERNGEVYVTTEAYEGFFSLHNYYYEWSRFTGVLKIVSKNDTEVIFTVGSDKALVNGKEEKLAETFNAVDGLPEVPLFWLYNVTGTKYVVEGKTIEVFAADGKYIEVLKNRKVGEWEFEIPGDMEGFNVADATAGISGGCLNGEAIPRQGNTISYDPRYTISGLALEYKKYNVATIRMKADVEKDTILNLDFTTTNESNWNQDKSMELPVKASDNGKFVEYTLKMGENSKWNGNITALRLDPIGCAGSFSIDYMRISKDSSIKSVNGLPSAENLKNGDAEGSEMTFYGNSKITIVKNEERNSNVFLVEAKQKKSWLYARQNLNWEPGAKYEITADVCFTNTYSGSTDAKTQLYCNAVYQDNTGKTDHIKSIITMSPTDGWNSVKVTIEIPADIKDGDNGQFAFYTNPTGKEGEEETMNYMFDNLVITKLS